MKLETIEKEATLSRDQEIAGQSRARSGEELRELRNLLDQYEDPSNAL